MYYATDNAYAIVSKDGISLHTKGGIKTELTEDDAIILLLMFERIAQKEDRGNDTCRK